MCRGEAEQDEKDFNDFWQRKESDAARPDAERLFSKVFLMSD